MLFGIVSSALSELKAQGAELMEKYCITYATYT